MPIIGDTSGPRRDPTTDVLSDVLQSNSLVSMCLHLQTSVALSLCQRLLGTMVNVETHNWSRYWEQVMMEY